MIKFIQRLFLVVTCAVVCTPVGYAASTPTQLFESFSQGESVAIMRHAIAPGGGDPANFDVSDCSTQRNLSREGRLQAQNIGDLFRVNKIEFADVYSSQWCRCLDTGMQLNFEKPTELPMLNSFFQDRTTANQQTEALFQWIKDRLENKETTTTLPAVLVTHQVNITGLTGVFPASGEIVFVTISDNVLVTLGQMKTE